MESSPVAMSDPFQIHVRPSAPTDLGSPASVVVVIGMHRSGTSAITQLLGANGFDLGDPDQLVRANTFNLRGHFENRGVFDFDEAVLERLGGSWSAPPSIDAVVAAAGDLVPVARRRWDELRVAYTQGIPIVKDPRLSLLLPIWLEAFGPHAFYVACVRNPMSVAQSLQARDGMELVAGCALWESYVVAMLRGLAGQRVMFVNVDEVLERSGQRLELVRMVRSWSGLARADEVDDTIEPELARRGPRSEELGQHLTVGQLALYQALLRLPDSPVIFGESYDAQVSQHATSVLAYASVAKAAESSAAEFEAMTRALDEAQSARAELSEEGVRLGLVTSDLRDQLQGLRQELEKVTRERDTRSHVLKGFQYQLRRMASPAEISALRASVRALESELQRIGGQLRPTTSLQAETFRQDCEP